MTDETSQPEGTPSPATPEESPTEENKPFTYDDAVADTGDEDDVAPAAPVAAPPIAEAPTQAAPVMAVAPVVATPVEAAPASTDRPSGIFIPKWVGLVAAAIVAALIFGGIGYAIGDSSDSGSSQAASNNFPNGTRNGNGTQTLPGGGQFPGNGELPNGNGSGGSGSNGGGTTTSNGAFLGIGVQTSTDPKGVAVTQVADNSPASKAGLQQGDVITAIDGNSITSADALRTAVQAKASGDEISVTYTRDGQSSTVKATLTSRSQTQSN